MRDQEIIGLWEAYQQVHAQPEEVEVVDEARRADEEGYERGTPANPTNRNVPTGDPSQRSMLHSKVKRRADEMGRERRSSAAYRAGSRPPVSKKEKAFLRASDRTRQSVSNPPVPDTGRHAGVSRYDREDSSNPKRNPKHNANKETAAESFDLFDYLLEYLVAEGYADTNENALVIMANMSDEWKQSIMESGVTMPDGRGGSVPASRAKLGGVPGVMWREPGTPQNSYMGTTKFRRDVTAHPTDSYMTFKQDPYTKKYKPVGSGV